jgi:hypothetical protein
MTTSAEAIPNPTEISVVVQGPLHGDLTRRALQSVRQHLPGSEIILSTWARSDVSGLGYDRLVLSEDPGGYPQPHDPRFFYNVNRQIVSTAAGLRAAGRPFAVKLRSDMLLTGRGFLDYFNRYTKRSADYAVFERRVVCLTGVNPERHVSLFMPGDWFSFGLTTDLLRLWDIPLAPEPETSRYFQLHPEENRLGDVDLNRFNPEQYIWMQCILAKFPVSFRHNQDFSAEAIRVAEIALANNLILLSPRQINLETPRHRITWGVWATIYSHAEWVQLYRRHCDPAAHVPLDFTPVVKTIIQRALALRQALTGKPSGVRSPARRYTKPE